MIATASDSRLDRVADRLEGMRERATAAMDQWSARAGSSVRHGVEAVRDTSARLRDQAVHASDSTAGYVREEPWKAMLIAGAIGAIAMALTGLLMRSHRG